MAVRNCVRANLSLYLRITGIDAGVNQLGGNIGGWRPVHFLYAIKQQVSGDPAEVLRTANLRHACNDDTPHLSRALSGSYTLSTGTIISDTTISPSTLPAEWIWYLITFGGGQDPGGLMNIYWMRDSNPTGFTLGSYSLDLFPTYFDFLNFFAYDTGPTALGDHKIGPIKIWNNVPASSIDFVAETKTDSLIQRVGNWHYEKCITPASMGIDIGPMGTNFTATGTGIAVVNDSPLFTADDIAVSTFFPNDNSIDASTDTNLVLTFNKHVFPDTGNIRLYKVLGHELIETININNSSLVNFNVNIVTIDINELIPYTEYAVQVDDTAIKDILNDYWDGYADGYTDWSFTTAILDPDVVVFSPANNTSGAGVGDNLILEFNQDITIGTGNIHIYKNSGTLVQTIASNNSSHVTVGGDTVTIIPLSVLDRATHYYILVDDGAFIGVNSDWAGISSNKIWNFNTEPHQIISNNTLFGWGF